MIKQIYNPQLIINTILKRENYKKVLKINKERLKKAESLEEETLYKSICDLAEEKISKCEYLITIYSGAVIRTHKGGVTLVKKY